MFQPVHSRSVGDDIVQQILGQIRAGQLVEGDSLPSERALAEVLQVSRPTVRGALERLIDAGVLRNGSGRGGNARVSTRWVPPDLLAAHPDHLDIDHVLELLEARRTVEPRVAQLAALRGNAADFEHLQQSIDLLVEHQDDLVKAAQAEQLFHRLMWRTSRNRALESLMSSLYAEFGPVFDLMLRIHSDYETGVRLHRDTLAALRRGDPAEIETVMYEHLGHFEQILADVTGRTITRRVPAFLTT